MRRNFWVLGLAALPAVAWANSGFTLLGLAVFGYLLAGCLFVGTLEGGLLAWRREKRLRSPFLSLILGNYASGWVGAFALSPLMSDWHSFLSTGGNVLYAYWALAFLLSVVVEAPFVWFALRGKFLSRPIWVSTFAVNVVSYAILMPIGLSMTSVDLAKQVRLVPPSQIRVDPGWVYYEKDDQIRRVRTDGSRDEVVCPTPSKSGFPQVMPSPDGQRAVLVFTAGGAQGKDQLQVLDAKLGNACQANIQRINLLYSPALAFRPDNQEFATFEHGAKANLYGVRKRDPWSPLQVDHGDYSPSVLRMETMATRSWTSGTLLPCQTLIAHFGDAIVAFDIKGHKMAVLAEVDWACPTVLLDPEAAPTRSGHFVDENDPDGTLWAKLKDAPTFEADPEDTGP